MKVKFLVPGLPLAVRIILFALLQLLGIYIQLFLASYFFSPLFLLSLGIMAGGAALLSAANYRNKPVDLGFEDWKAASLSEFERIRSHMQKTKTIRLPLLYKPLFGILIIAGLVAAAFFLYMARIVFPVVFMVDVVIILFPFLFTGLVKLWTPVDLKMKMERLQAVFDFARSAEKQVIITPYLRLDKDKAGRQIPEDVRLMIEPRRKPGDFVGVQLQVAINNGPNGAVPYMYAVFLCRGKLASFKRISDTDFSGFIKEPGGDDAYGYVVMRQRTGGGGYHTTDKHCIRLYRGVLEVLNQLQKAV